MLKMGLKQEFQHNLMIKQKYLSQTKELVNGSRFYVYSKANFRYVYSCNLCGVQEIHESGLELHDKSVLHKELSKLENIPYKKWMKDCIVNENSTKHDHSKKLKLKLATTELDESRNKIDCSQKAHKKDENGNKMGHADRDGKSKKKHIPRSYKKFSISYESSNDSSDSDCVITKHQAGNRQRSFSEGDQATVRTFLSMCRQLTSLEDFLEDNLKDRVKDLFLKSVELERNSIGSSNTLLSMETLDFLFVIKASLSKRLDTMPFKFLRFINLFYDDMLHFTEIFATKAKMLKVYNNSSNNIARK